MTEKNKNKNKEEINLELAIMRAGREQPIKETTELGEAFRNLDEDVIDNDTKMSNIDFNTNLSEFQITCIMKIDELIRLGIFPKEAGITRQIKRLNISKHGQGRADKVQIATAGVERTADGFQVKKLFQRRE